MLFIRHYHKLRESGVYLHRAQQGVFPPQEALFPPPKDLQKLIKIHEISQLNANSSCLNCTPHVHYVVLKCYLGAFMGTFML